MFLSHRLKHPLRHPAVGEVKRDEAWEVTDEQAAETNGTGIWQLTDQPPEGFEPIYLRRAPGKR